ncbi:MAG: prephenate dehydrogenase/arogenate dehydrogenase family protein [Chloroflexi bacterium]|nr:prephenate dehydrogenase/arogenate dehydrogenase family protein [Chloroflexota bacterium]
MEDGFSLKDSTIGIVGLGLMGGSLAMSLKGKCARLIGYDTHLPALEVALSKGIIDHAGMLFPSPAGRGDRGEGKVNLLILATPVPSILQLLHQLQSTNYQSPITILDIGSTKRDILRAMSALPENFDPIGGHPICGREKLGLENADANLYQNAPFVITPLERTTQHALRIARQLVSALGAKYIEMNADDHDRILASTSHLPFLLASALVRSTAHDFAPLIGPGFRSTSRLAGTPSSMMLGILKSNRDNVLSALSTFQEQLARIKLSLMAEDYTALEDILNQSQADYLALVDG